MSIKGTTLTVTSTTYGSNPNITFPFTGKVAAVNKSATAIMFISFDGTTENEIRMDPADVTKSLITEGTYTKAWARLDVAGSSDMQFAIESARV